MALPSKRFFHKDGDVHIAYSILGSHHLGRRRPLVFLNGLGFVADDWCSIATEMALKRPGALWSYSMFKLLCRLKSQLLPSSAVRPSVMVFIISEVSILRLVSAAWVTLSFPRIKRTCTFLYDSWQKIPSTLFTF